MWISPTVPNKGQSENHKDGTKSIRYGLGIFRGFQRVGETEANKPHRFLAV
jgi:hypothetical protein